MGEGVGRMQAGTGSGPHPHDEEGRHHRPNRAGRSRPGRQAVEAQRQRKIVAVDAT